MAPRVDQMIRGQGWQPVPPPASPPPAEPPPVTPPEAPVPVAETPPPASPGPDEEPTDEAPQEPEGDETDETVTVAEHQRRKARRRPDAEARINELVARQHDIQRELDAERRQREALLTQLLHLQGTQPPRQPEQPPTPEQTPAAPTPDDFEDHDAYVAALVEWRVEQGTAKAIAAYDARMRERQAADAQQALQQRLEQRFVTGRTQYPDFETAIQAPGNAYSRELIPVLHEIVAESEHGHVLMYQLATQPVLRDELNDRSPEGARRYLRKLVQDLAAPAPSAPPEPPARRPSVPRPPAATPIEPVNGTAAPLRQDAASIAQQQGRLRDYMAARGPYRR